MLFVDADGVLHPEPSHSGLQRLCWLPVLVEELEPFDDVRVVLHSSWRLDMPPSHIATLLAPLGTRYLGTTRGAGRRASIELWLSEHRERIEDWLILDDMQREFPTPAPAQLVICDGRLGLTDPVALSRLRKWLSL